MLLDYTLIHNEVFRATGQIPIPNALKKGCYCPAYFPVVLNFSENIASAGARTRDLPLSRRTR